MEVRWDPTGRVIRPKERNVRLRSNMGYLLGGARCRLFLAATERFNHLGEPLRRATCMQWAHALMGACVRMSV